MPEEFHIPDYILHVIVSVGLIDLCRQSVRRSVQFKDRVVHQMQRCRYFRPADAGGIGEHRNHSRREEPVAKLQRVAYNLREIRIESGFTVPGEGDRVDGSTVGGTGTQFFFKQCTDFSRVGKLPVRSAVGIPTAFAVDAVEIAELAFRRKQVNPKRVPEPP